MLYAPAASVGGGQSNVLGGCATTVEGDDDDDDEKTNYSEKSNHNEKANERVFSGQDQRPNPKQQQPLQQQSPQHQSCTGEATSRPSSAHGRHGCVPTTAGNALWEGSVGLQGTHSSGQSTVWVWEEVCLSVRGGVHAHS